MKDKKKNPILLNQWFDIVIVILVTITLIVSLCTFYNCLDKNRPVEDIKYTYNINNDLNYKVYIYKNNFYEEEYLDMERSYMSKLVDTINFELSNNLNVSNIYNVEYDYTVTATLNAKSEDSNNFFDNVLWTKNYTLIPTTYGSNSDITNNSINIPIELDFQSYHQLVTEFQNQMRLDLDAHLDVKTVINYQFYVSGDKITRSETFNVKIPLAEQTFEITTQYDENFEDVIYYEESISENKIKIFAATILFVSSLFGGIVLILTLVDDIKKTEYIKKLNKILKSYGDIIAGVSNLPNLDDKEICDVISFDELVNIEEELKIPIIYFEYKRNKEGWFLIMYNELIYRYTLKETKKRL